MSEFFPPEPLKPIVAPPPQMPVNILTRPDGTTYAVPKFVWDADKTQAAADLAEGMKLGEVAARAAVGPQTLKTWRLHPEFQARVEEHRKAFAELVMNHSIARQEVRVAKLVALSEGIESVIEGRKQRALKMAADAAAKAASDGVEPVPFDEQLTGLTVEKPTQYGTEIRFDRGLTAEYRDTLKQVAIEKGEWADGDGSPKVAVQIVVPAAMPRADQLPVVTIGRQG